MASYQALAFDYGLKNIGVATGQSMTHSATELRAINAKDGIPNWQQVEALIKEWRPKKVIVGLPLNMDGSESEMCARARKFGRRLGRSRYSTIVVAPSRRARLLTGGAAQGEIRTEMPPIHSMI